MKSLTIAASLLGLTLACLPWPARGEAKPTPLPDSDSAVGPKSVFIVEPGFGKDPFFPRSIRVLPKTNELSAPIPPPSPAVPDEIVLKGINLLKSTRLAIINYYTVAQGEEFDLKLKGKTYRVRCVEINDKSVVIRVNGITKELVLRSGI